MNKSHRTAISRSRVSLPVQYLIDNDLLEGDILDYGCGYGYDALALGADFYDKYYYPVRPTRQYDVIVCNYVLNVVGPDEEREILKDIQSMLKPNGRAYISVRRDSFKEGTTKTGTYQRYSKPDLPSVVLRSGSFQMYTLCKV